MTTLRYQKNPAIQQRPGSVTKWMTALVVRDWVTDAMLDNIPVVPGTSTTVVSADTVDWGTNSNAGLLNGDNLSWRDLLYGALLPSGNDAAKCLARQVGYLIRTAESSSGDYVARFVTAMNAKATALGMSNSSFSDSIGIDIGNLTTAEDLAKACWEYANDSLLLTVGGTYQRTLTITGANARTYQVTHTVNPSGTIPFPEMVAAKTGTVFYGGDFASFDSGGCLAMIWDTPSHGRRVSVVLGSDRQTLARYKDMRALLDFELNRLS